MRAAVDNFLALSDDGFEGGKILILGDMRELGDFSREEHRAIIDRIAETAATRSAALTCYVVGPEFSAALAASNASRDRKPLIIRAFANVTEWMAAVANGEIVIRNAQVLVKGSRGMTLEKLYPLL